MEMMHACAAAQVINKIGGGCFTEEDEKMIEMLCDHIGIFIGNLPAP